VIKSTLGVVIVTSALVVPMAFAARAPTLVERAAIIRALPKSIRDVPTECVWLNVRVSRTPAYASVVPRWLNWERPRSRCLRYAADGFFVLSRKAGRWHVVYLGSDSPPCSIRLPRDLTDCVP